MIPTGLTEPPPDEHDADWSQTLATGAPGLVLLHAEHARATGDATTLHPWVRAMTSRPMAAHHNIGLFQGVPAVAYALRSALLPGHPSYDAYRSTLDMLDARITELIRDRLALAHERQARAELPQMREYDLIQGMTGLGAYLLHRDPADPQLCEVLTYLVTLTRPVTVDGVPAPGWWTPTAPNSQPSPDWPRGHANFGIAHGIAGPLALLAITHRRGITVPGHVDAITDILCWYDLHRIDDANGSHWPETTTSPVIGARTEHVHPGRPSWCYGTPGIARAHQLAALALGDVDRATAAEHALAACLSDPAQLALLTDLSLCHGLAGVVLTAWRAAADAGPNNPLAALLPHLRGQLSYSATVSPPEDPGLLEGAAGTALAVYTTANRTTQPMRWDHCLLING